MVFAGNFVMAGNPDNGGKPARATINSMDTVVFDLSEAITNGDAVQFPVYISTAPGDTAFTLDFAFKFNHANLYYDSIIFLLPYSGKSLNYDTLDSTVRFFCYPSGFYKSNIPIVAIHFTTISKPISSSDLNITLSLINGDGCSYKIIDPITTGLSTLSTVQEVGVRLYPNPAKEVLNVELAEKATIQLFDINGREVVEPISGNENQKVGVNTQNIANGIYTMKIYNDNFISTRKVVINK